MFRRLLFPRLYSHRCRRVGLLGSNGHRRPPMLSTTTFKFLLTDTLDQTQTQTQTQTPCETRPQNHTSVYQRPCDWYLLISLSHCGCKSAASVEPICLKKRQSCDWHHRRLDLAPDGAISILTCNTTSSNRLLPPTPVSGRSLDYGDGNRTLHCHPLDV